MSASRLRAGCTVSSLELWAVTGHQNLGLGDQSRTRDIIISAPPVDITHTTDQMTRRD